MEKKYFLEIITDEDNKPTLFIITEGKKGRGVIIANNTSFKVLSEAGWLEKQHKDFKELKLSDDNKHALIYYKQTNDPIEIKIPTIDVNELELTVNHINAIIDQMKKSGKTYDDFWEEYLEGTSALYRYDEANECFLVTKMDITEGSFFTEDELSEEEVRNIIKENGSMFHLREQGFIL